MGDYNASFFEGKYYGQSLCQDGNTQQRANVATHAVRTALDDTRRRPKLSVVTTAYGLTLLDPTSPGAEANVFAYVPLRDLACITLHDKDGKRKMLALLIRRRDGEGRQVADGKLDCHVFTLKTQAIARRFYDHVRKICQEAAIHRKLDAQRMGPTTTDPSTSAASPGPKGRPCALKLHDMPATKSPARKATKNPDASSAASMAAPIIPSALASPPRSPTRPRPVMNAWA